MFGHIKKSLKRWLADNTLPKSVTYSSYAAHELFDFINIEFDLNIQRRNFTFCPKDLQQKVIDLLEKHLHWPNANGQFLSSEINSVLIIIYNMWINWYQKKCGFCASIEICVFQHYNANWVPMESTQAWLSSKIFKAHI